jgi:thiosulfate/3-mercaptopyruvate sulfurtransferase
MENNSMIRTPVSDTLVDLDWVEAHGKDAGVRLVEVDVDTTAYDTGHIPGAVGWNWQTELQDPLCRDVASPEAFAGLLGRSGVANDTTVVLYGDNNNWFAAYAAWLLRYYGHKGLKLVDGGRKRWLAEGRPLETGRPAYREQVQSVVQRSAGKVSLVDVRSPAEFSGEILAPPGMAEAAQRAGHIPGAVNVPWATAVNEDGTFQSPEALRALYEAQGVSAEKPVITYCRIGERSAHTWFVLTEILGFPNVRNYDGSWTEWGSMVGVPVERTADAPAPAVA